MTTTQPRAAQSAAEPGSGRWWRQRTELGFAAGVLGIAVFLTFQILAMEVPEGVGSPGPKFFPTLIAGFLYVTGTLLAITVIRNPRHTGPGAAGSSVSTDMLEDLGGLDDTGEITVVRAGERPRRREATPAQSAAEDKAGDTAVDDEAGDTGVDDSQSAPSAGATARPGNDYIPVDYRTVGLILAGLVGFVVLLEPVGWLFTSAALFWVVSHALGSKRAVFDIAVALIVASFIQLAFSAGLGLSLPAGFLEGLLPWSN